MTKIGQLKLEDIQAEIRRLAAEQPDYVYGEPGGDCRYLEADASGELVGSCIVGQAFVNLGVDPEQIAPFEGEEASSVLACNGFDAGSPFARWINDVQMGQDDRKAWSVAVAVADHAYPTAVSK